MAHILIADDDPILVELMSTMLQAAGHKVSKCASGLEALRKLGLEPENGAVELPHLLILDLMMPKSDGYTVGTLIRSHARTRHIPILVVSSLSEPSRLFSATVKVDGFLNKTSIIEALIPTVSNILDKRTTQTKA